MSLSLTLIIIIITVIVSFTANSNPDLYAKLMFNPYQVVHRKEWFRVITHGFIHDRNSIFHLIFNMYVLYSFGRIAEEILTNLLGVLGVVYFIVLYFGGMIVATIPAIIKHKDNYHYNSVGASGAVSAVLFATIAFIPFSGGIGILFIPVSIPPLVFGILYIAYEVYMQKRGGTNIAHDAHIWGAIFGFLFVLFFVPDAFTNFMAQLTSLL